MKKLIRLLKAAMSQDMDMFKYKTKASDSKAKQIIFPIILSLIVMFAVGVYAVMFASEFSKVNLTYIMLTLFIILTTILTLVEYTNRKEYYLTQKTMICYSHYQ